MSEINNSQSPTADREILFTRTFDAPRELVFDAWTNPKHIAAWWGPNGFTTTTYKMDPKTGGIWRFVMHGPDGVDYHNRIVFLEIARPGRIVYKHEADKDCEPVNFQVTVTLDDEGGKTKLMMRMVFPSAQAHNFVVEEYGAIEGGNQNLERLGHFLSKSTGNISPPPAATDQQFVITRIFDAPRERVFKAWTDRDDMMRWWGPKGFTLLSAKNDLRPGGSFHYCMRSPEGAEMWGKWVYREVTPPERIVFISSFSDEAGGLTRHPFAPKWPLELLTMITFSEFEGRTTLTVRWVNESKIDAERKTFAAGHASMQQGWTGTLDRLPEALQASPE